WSSVAVRWHFKRNPIRLFALQKKFQTGRTLPLCSIDTLGAIPNQAPAAA
ncbi:hypothetical protein EJ02DRAFT_362048, partial [Clathrospora elynae]